MNKRFHVLYFHYAWKSLQHAVIMTTMPTPKQKLAIVLDSSSDLSNEEASQLGVYVIRMPLTVDGKQYLEGTNITDEELIALMKGGSVITTAQPPIGALLSLWTKLLEEYQEILFIPISSKLSGTCSTAAAAARAFEGRIFVADCLSACAPIQVLVRFAKQLSMSGYGAEEIKYKIEQECSTYAVIVPETLTYLKRGGRIKPAVALLGNLLQIIPILKVDQGEIDVLGKVRTVRKAYRQAMEGILNVDDRDQYEWMVVVAGTVDYEPWKAEFEQILGHEVPVRKIRAIVMAHTGPGTLGFARVHKFSL